MRIVADTNTVLSGLLWQGPPRRLLDLARQRAFTPCTSKTAYERCADCPDEQTCALRKPLKAARAACAQVLEQATLAEAAGLGQHGRPSRVVNFD